MDNKNYWPMEISKLQELVELRKADDRNTYSYVDRTFKFIKTLRSAYAKYLGCGNENVVIIVPTCEGKLTEYGLLEDNIKISPDGFFTFTLLTKLHTPDDDFPAFNINNSGRSFFEQGLTPPSALGYRLGVKEEGIGFTVKLLDASNKAHHSFSIEPESNQTFSNEKFTEMFDLLFQNMKTTLESGLDGRLQALVHPKTDAIGYRY